MTENTSAEMTWDILDRDTVRALVERKGSTTLIEALNSATPSPQAKAEELVDLAIAGRIATLKEHTSSLCDWAEEHGARRIENALIELGRVLASEKRGEGLLHAQALTRFISRHIGSDVKALKAAIKGTD